MTMPDVEHHRIPTNGIQLHVAQAGPLDGPLVVLLHGFPEFWYGWRHQIPALSEAGYRLWIPDQRGYNLSDKPKGVSAYRLETLAADILGLIEASGRERVFLVGHDWGAAVAWWIAIHDPERLQRLVILNVPHGAVMLRHLRRNPRQMLRSWYMLFFQLPWLPERLARMGDWRMMARVLKSSSRPGTFSDEDLDWYRQAWSQPGAITAMLNWYRALLRKRPRLAAAPRVTVPTLIIWGANDSALGREMAAPSLELCEAGRLVFFEEATHWVQHEEPERVNTLILDEFTPHDR